MLQILPILRYFVENFVAGPRGIDTTGECAAEIESFIAMCDVVKILQACKHYGVTPARKQDLLAAARRHLQFFARVYGESCVKPKHHFMLHVAVLVNEWSVLLDCYVHERKHKAIKQAASQIYNTESFERSVLARVVLEQTRSLKNNVATFRPGLRGTTRPFPEVARALGAASVAASLSLKWGAMPIGKGDLVMFEHTLVLVVLCLDADGELALLVRVCDVVAGQTSRWQMRAAISCICLSQWPREAVRLASCWIFEEGQRILVLL